MIYVLKISCPDRKGLVHKISGVLFKHGLNMIENEEFVDIENNLFFMRSELEGEIKPGEVQKEVKAVLPGESSVQLLRQLKKNIVVLATKEHHCLGDLLVRHQFNELNANISAVVSNHEYLEEFSGKFGIPFHYVPAQGKNRIEHEHEIMKAVKVYNPHYLVLARYMRVLSPGFVNEFPMRIINIHHSFLPAFAGARPYHQAHKRGVKMIGATAHFVTQELDEGPIITQDAIQTTHAMSPAQMARAGREVEKQVLAKALKLVFDDRVFISGSRTIILE